MSKYDGRVGTTVNMLGELRGLLAAFVRRPDSDVPPSEEEPDVVDDDGDAVGDVEMVHAAGDTLRGC